MDLETATLLTTDIFTHFQNESLEDVVLMLKMARTGRLGKGNGRLDSDTLFTIFIPNYLLFQAEEREKIHHRDKTSNQREILSPEAYKKFDELSQMLTQNKQKRDLQNPPPPVVNHHQIYVSKIRNSVRFMKDKELNDTLLNAKAADNHLFKEVIEILTKEIKKRDADKKKAKEENEKAANKSNIRN